MARSDATARRAPEAAHSTLALLDSSSVVGYVLIDSQGEIRRLNPLFGNWLGLSSPDEAQGSNLYHWLRQPTDAEALAEAMNPESGGRVALHLEHDNGTQQPVVGDLIPLGESENGKEFVGLFQESMADRLLRVGMERSARLEALGSLTSGVAHDLNNRLTILIGNLSLAAEEVRSQPEQFARLQAAREAAENGGELIKQLLSFARQEPVASQLINPAEVIVNVVPLIRRAMGGRIALEIDVDDKLDPVHGNSAQLESVIVNLAVNAKDAIESEGCVRIGVFASDLNAEEAKRFGLEPGPYLNIEVRDNGSGIPPHVVSRVYEPFFTTKGDGEGSGLGLTMVKLYADQFDGATQIVSRPGEGTTVRLLFPSSPGQADLTSSRAMPVASLPSGREDVLLVASDEGLSRMLDQILSILGYRCRIACDVDTATALVTQATPELVVVDGFELCHSLQLRDIVPTAATRILVLETVGAEPREVTHPILHKPFSIPDLAITVRETLDANA